MLERESMEPIPRMASIIAKTVVTISSLLRIPDGRLIATYFWM
jgi:hypothetical protein